MLVKATKKKYFRLSHLVEKNSLLPVLEAKGFRLRCQQSWLFLCTLEDNQSHVSIPVPGGLLVIVITYQNCSFLSLYCLSLLLLASLFFLFLTQSFVSMRRKSCWIRNPSPPVWSHTDYNYNDYDSKIGDAIQFNRSLYILWV